MTLPDLSFLTNSQIRVAILGAAGTGKTTTAQLLAKTANIPFLSRSTSSLMEEYNLQSHYDVLKMCAAYPFKGISFHKRLIDDRYELYSSTAGPWVTDRSCLDSFIYYLIQCACWDSDASSAALLDKSVADLRENFDLIVVYQPGKILIEQSDSKRVHNLLWHMAYAALHKKYIITNVPYGKIFEPSEKSAKADPPEERVWKIQSFLKSVILRGKK